MEASMRPRHFAADNDAAPIALQVARGASMRPRHFAADNCIALSGPFVSVVGFNEAAAFRRG